MGLRGWHNGQTEEQREAVTISTDQYFLKSMGTKMMCAQRILR